MLVIDGANVIGSRPDGWWRDRPGAARRLYGRIEQALRSEHLDAPVVLVLEGDARAGVAPTRSSERSGPAGELQVVHATGSGDDQIVSIAEEAAHEVEGSDPAVPLVMVVTADRGLRRRLAPLGAALVGPSWLLDILDRAEADAGST